MALQDLQERRREVAGKAQEILRIADLEERGLSRLRNSLKQEYETALPKIAAKLGPVVRQFSEEVRMSMAEGEGNLLRDYDAQLRDLQKTREERLQWLKSLKQSVDWGFAR